MVVEPAGCSVGGGRVETKPFTVTLGMGGSGTEATLRFVPQTGLTFAIVELEGTKCPIAGLYKFNGTFFAEAVNATKVFSKSQEFKSSEAIQKSAGTAGSLKFGECPAFLTGTVKGTLVSGESWGGEQ